MYRNKKKRDPRFSRGMGRGGSPETPKSTTWPVPLATASCNTACCLAGHDREVHCTLHGNGIAVASHRQWLAGNGMAGRGGRRRRGGCWPVHQRAWSSFSRAPLMIDSLVWILEEYGWFGGMLEEFVREKHCSGWKNKRIKPGWRARERGLNFLRLGFYLFKFLIYSLFPKYMSFSIFEKQFWLNIY